jgi:ABC-2 type transport system ATP-binding protein
MTVGAPSPSLPPAVALVGLTKRFRNGVVAVDGLTLTVQQGAIFGLLGLNGAGKTTTLRMLLGLARPTAGNVRIFGEPVGPGAPVLARVGSLVDAPGFVPHLSGRENLVLHHAAGGGDPDDPVVSEALRVAGLGEAAERKVRSYSFGMRQRLGIALALLGGPSLLVLDEPTTGLDPQEVREVRALIRTVASHGTTVLLSSHLLAEVEQVCTHVAVLDRGRLVTTGTLPELTAASRWVWLEVDDAPTAMLVLGQLPGVASVRLDGPGLLVEVAGARRADLVAALVAAGVGVETVTARQRLEDAFMGLVSAEPG